MTIAHRENPYPGLRPFRADETHLFFGRDEQRSELLGRLRRSRFLAVVGTSGSGKSSLVRAGLLPGLYGGFMAGSESQWRIADLHPGNDPIGNLARALDRKGALRDVALGKGELSFTEANLRRSSLGLAEATRRARLSEDARLAVLVDQFEELFRFMAAVDSPKAYDDASVFIKILLEASLQTKVPIYIVITMRSDFLGDCARFRDLPEAINDGQYLIPRMTRDQRREAIEGPAAVYGASLSPTLVNRILNDVGDNPDQLPILQHALMRTWDHWKGKNSESNIVDLKDYEDPEVGGMTGALSLHADSILAELAQDCDEEEGKKRQQIAEDLFKCLTEKTATDYEIRRLARLQEIANVAGVNSDEMISVIDVFRQPGNSFLMPPIGEELTPETYIDISHESLIRNWGTLKRLVDDEVRSARIYQRLAQTAVLHRAGKEDLLAEQALRVALEWKVKQQPTAAWAMRYDPAFDTAMEFLALSESKANKIVEEQARTRRLKRTLVVGLLLLLLSAALFWFYKAQRQFETAKLEKDRHTAEIEREASDRRVLSILYSLRGNTFEPENEVTELKDKKLLEYEKFVSPVHSAIADKIVKSGNCDEKDKLLCSLYRSLELRNLEEAKTNLAKLIGDDPDTPHFAAANHQWANWGEIQAIYEKKEARDRRLLSTLYALHWHLKKRNIPAELIKVVSELKVKKVLEYDNFVSPVHSAIADKIAKSEELSLKDKYLVTIYFSLEAEKQGEQPVPDELKEKFPNLARDLLDKLKKESPEPAQAYLNKLKKEFSDSRHALLAQSAVKSRKEREERELLSKMYSDYIIYDSYFKDAQICKQKIIGKFENPVHSEVAQKICETDFIRFLGNPNFDEVSDRASKEYLLATVYWGTDPSFPSNVRLARLVKRLEDAKLASKKLETKYPYTIHALLADAALNAAEPAIEDPIKIAVKKVYVWGYDFWVLIVLMMIWPLWFAWEWVRRRLWKDAKIKAKPPLIPRMLAVVTDIVIAVALSIFVLYFVGAISAIIMATLGAIGVGEYNYTSSVYFYFGSWTTIPIFAVPFSLYLLFRDAIKYRFHRSIGKIIYRLRPIVVTPAKGAVTLKVSAKRNWIVVILLILVPFSLIMLTTELFSSETASTALVSLLIILALFIVVEIILAAIKEGRTIHDRLGGTRVIDIRSEALSS